MEAIDTVPGEPSCFRSGREKKKRVPLRHGWLFRKKRNKLWQSGAIRCRRIDAMPTELSDTSPNTAASGNRTQPSLSITNEKLASWYSLKLWVGLQALKLPEIFCNGCSVFVPLRQ